ncbi:MAG TPA: PASTA domain-containing protein, partial [Mycobacteriales bacterium]
QDVNNEAPAGTVVATVPRAGTKVTEGQQIVVQVSSGKIPLPDVTNKPRAEALRELNQKGFANVQPRDAVPPDDFEPGVVFQTNPSPGTFVSKDAVITIYVAKAKPSPTPEPTTPSPSPSSSPTSKKPPGSPPPTP